MMNVCFIKETEMFKDINTNEIVAVIPEGTEVQFDYNITIIPGDVAYHFNYKGQEGFVYDIPAGFSMPFYNFVMIE